MHSSRSDVEEFLTQMRKAIDANLFIPVDRSKNLHTLAMFGITWEDAKDEIRSLTYSNYISGPEPDYDLSEPDPVWIFKKYVDSQLIYIKLKICCSMNDELKVISFHIDFMT